MRILYIVTISVCIVCNSTFLHSQSIQWAKGMGGTGDDRGRSIAIDAAKNIYTTGEFEATADFDPGADTFNLTSAGLTDIFISKLDSNGKFIWAKRIGSTFDECAYALTVDKHGNVYTTGYFKQTTDFDPGPDTFQLTHTGSYDVFIVKLDSGGNFLWAKSFSGADWDEPQSIALDSFGNIFTTGYFRTTMDCDPGIGIYELNAVGSMDVFISKLDSGGNFLWARSFGGALSDYGFSIAIDYFGNSYTTGVFANTVDFDPGIGTYNLTTIGFYELFIEKLDPNGNFLWATKTTSPATKGAQGSSIIIDANKYIYMTGYFDGTVDFDPSPKTMNLSASGGNDIFISKSDLDGNFFWAKKLGGSNIDRGYSITSDRNGFVYATGYLSFDVFIAKLDAAGNFVSTILVGSKEDDYGRQIAIDNEMNMYLIGYFAAIADFDPGISATTLISMGKVDAFVAKYSQCSNTSGSISAVGCNHYTSPSRKYTWTSSGKYTDTIPNAGGCDSIITIDLTIQPVINTITSVFGIDGTLSFVSDAQGDYYQWLDCNKNYAPIPGAVHRSFTPSHDGSYAVKVTTNDCSDTSICHNIIGADVSNRTFNTRPTIHPNPTDGLITIDLGELLQSTDVIITDTKGREIARKHFSNTSMLVFFLDGACGVYHLNILSGKKTNTFWVIKQ